MCHYKAGDTCPFCGRVIPDNATPAMLSAISAAADEMHLQPPEEPVPDVICQLISKDCPANKFADHRCCLVCEKYTICTRRCMNDPARCRQSKYMSPVVQLYDGRVGGAPYD